MQSSGSKRMYTLDILLSVEEFRSLLLSYLWFKDIISVSSTNKIYRSIILDEDTIVPYEVFNRLLQKSGRHTDRIDLIKWNFRTMMSFARRLTKWPSTLALSPAMREVDDYEIEFIDRETNGHLLPVATQHNQNVCFAYQGYKQGDNRAVVSDDHFPVMIQSAKAPITAMRPIHAVPFTKIVYDTETHKSIPVLSYIAYYEITIHSTKQPYRPTPSQRQQQINLRRRRFGLAPDSDEEDTAAHNPLLQPCVCIGIARPGFDLYGSMPGWDEHSMAFHGDDGLYFGGQPDHGMDLHDDPRSTLTFGEGDTVGFGIIYPNSGIHLDANGAIPPIKREEQEKKVWNNWQRAAEWARKMMFQTDEEAEHSGDEASTISNASSSTTSSSLNMDTPTADTEVVIPAAEMEPTAESVNGTTENLPTITIQTETQTNLNTQESNTEQQQQQEAGQASNKLDKDEESHGKIFFTKNGKLAASVCIQNDEHFFEYPWFPAIGTDCYNIIEVNFGNTDVPFRFDVVAFEQNKSWMTKQAEELTVNMSSSTSNATAVNEETSKNNNGEAGAFDINKFAIENIRPNPCLSHTMQQIQQKWKRYSLSSSTSATSTSAMYPSMLIPSNEYYSIYCFLKDYNYNWKEVDKQQRAAAKKAAKEQATKSVSNITTTILESVNRLRASSFTNELPPEENKQESDDYWTDDDEDDDDCFFNCLRLIDSVCDQFQAESEFIDSFLTHNYEDMNIFEEQLNRTRLRTRRGGPTGAVGAGNEQNGMTMPPAQVPPPPPPNMTHEMFARMLQRMQQQAAYLFEPSDGEDEDDDFDVDMDEYELEDDDDGYEEDSEDDGAGEGHTAEAIAAMGSPRRRARRRMRMEDVNRLEIRTEGETGNNPGEEEEDGNNRRPRSNSETLMELYRMFRHQAGRISSSFARRMRMAARSAAFSNANTPTTPNAFYFLGEHDDEVEGNDGDEGEEEDEEDDWEDVDEDDEEEEEGEEGGAVENPMVDYMNTLGMDGKILGNEDEEDEGQE